MPQESENQNNDQDNEIALQMAMQESKNKNSENENDKEIKLKKLQAKAAKLEKEIAEFSITLFTLAMLFAGTKDLFDICSVELASWLDWIIDLSFGGVLFFGLGKGSFQQIKRIRMTTGITAGAEVIPIIGALPCWTASLLGFI